ncbi:M28 family metallopeptidase [Sinosporangium siamense]|nr:M28 family metallopeptidase [Sinosporangium siamense]
MFNFYRELAKPTLERVGGTPYSPADITTIERSGSGDVTARVQAVDVKIPPGDRPNTSTSGCEVADFRGFVPGNVALMQRGTCQFTTKVANATAAGAAAVIIFNEGQPGRTAPLLGEIENPVRIPVIATSSAIGENLATNPVTVRVTTRVESEPRLTHNLFAQTPHGSTDDVVMIGAHLDSVQAGPGINDNGSGVGALLEIALAMIDKQPRRAVRFAWWGAEEEGLIGSKHYVRNLSHAEREKIALYLNFDMVASPNHVYGIYDGDDSDGVGAGPGPAGSAAIEREFQRFYERRGLPYTGMDFTGRSDYGPFIDHGIPAGGLFTGAEAPKTALEAARFGGTAGQALDRCYHRVCDDLANVGATALDVNTDAIASVTAALAWQVSRDD